MIEKFHKILENLEIDYLLVNSTNEYLVEYSSLQENARAKISGFLGSTGDVLLTKEKQYLFVDGRYHEQADLETYDYFSIVKLQLGQNQDDEIRKIIDKTKTLGIVAKKVSQTRLESFTGYKIKLLDFDPINDFTESYSVVKAVRSVSSFDKSLSNFLSFLSISLVLCSYSASAFANAVLSIVEVVVSSK